MAQKFYELFLILISKKVRQPYIKWSINNGKSYWNQEQCPIWDYGGLAACIIGYGEKNGATKITVIRIPDPPL